MKFNFYSLKSKTNKAHLITGMLCLLVVGLSSCLKNNNKYNNNTQKPIALLSVMNAAPDVPAADFYFNGSLINATQFPYGNFIAYFNVPAGSGNVGFYTSGTSTTIATDTATFKANQVYTLFFSNVAPNHDFVLVHDTIAAPASSSANIRLVNVSPDAPAVDLVLHGTVLIANKKYKQASSFISVPASVNDTLQVRQTGTNIVLGSIPPINLQSGAVYTVWLYGFASAGASDPKKLNVGFMTNAVFY